MACAMELMRVLLPAQERHLLLHPISLVSSLSRRNLKSLVGDLVRKRDAPRYIASFLRIFTCSWCLISLLMLGRECLEKKIPDLFQLISWPDQLQYFSIHLMMLAASFLVAFEKSTISSAYITWVMAGPPTCLNPTDVVGAKLTIKDPR